MSKSTWPTMTDYAAMIAHPETFLSDSDLKRASVTLNSLDMPLNWCGNNAIVFRLFHNGKAWAVRCFTRAIRDHPDRYAHIHAHLTTPLTSTIFVNFTYLDEGILISGIWYPVVKMEWAEGQTLEEAIDSHVSTQNTSALRKLSKVWVRVISDLQSHNIAHGDLQHDNIIVNDDKIKLVDYDGMYVPSLKGHSSLELGLPHYQHPGRTGKHFDANLDNFSAIVIYLTLRSLASDSSLWERFHQEKRLLFSEEDYKDPDNSAVFRAMQNCQDDKVRKLTEAFREICKKPITAVPPLGSLLNRQASASPPEPRKRSGQMPDWMKHSGDSLSYMPRHKSGPRPSWLEKPDDQTQKRPKSGALPDWMKSGE